MIVNIPHTELIDHGGLENAQKKLLPSVKSGERGSAKQQEFLATVAEDPNGFCEEVRSWGLSGEKPHAVFETKLTEKEFKNPPWETETVIFNTWSDLSENMASRPGFWARVTIELTEQKLIQSSYLASPSNKTNSGLSRLKEVLHSGNAKDIDSCVRAVFRRMGGIITDRGARTVYLDCPIAKAWWRRHYSIEAHKHFRNIPVERYSETLCDSGLWETLVQAMVSRLTVIGDHNIRPALLTELAENVERGVNMKRQEIKTLLDAVGQRTAVQALGALSPKQVHGVLKEELLPGTPKIG